MRSQPWLNNLKPWRDKLTHFATHSPKQALFVGLGVLVVAIALTMAIKIMTFPKMNMAFEPMVETAAVEHSTIPVFYETLGQVEAEQNVTLHSETAGIVDKVWVKEGQWVKAHQPLLRLKPEKPQAELNEVLSQLEQAHLSVGQARDRYQQAKQDLNAATSAKNLAEKELARYKALFTKQYVSQQDVDMHQNAYDAALAKYESARSGLNVAKLQYEQTQEQVTAAGARGSLYRTRLSDATITAPFSGWVGLKYVTVGDYVQPLSNMISLVNPSVMRIVVPVPQRHASELTVGHPVLFYLGQQATQKPLVLPIQFVSPDTRTDAQTVIVKASLANVPNEIKVRLRPGQAGLARVTLAQVDNAILVPEESVFGLGEKQYVYVVKNHKAKLTEVQTGQHVNGWVHIKTGVRVKQHVITAGLQKVQDGAKVKETLKQATLPDFRLKED